MRSLFIIGVGVFNNIQPKGVVGGISSSTYIMSSKKSLTL